MDVLKRFRMMNCKLAPTPIALGTNLNKEDVGYNVDPSLFKILVGNIIHLTATRPYIMYILSLISRFMDSPKDLHWQVGKIIIRYIVGTSGYDILYSKTSNVF